MSFCSLMWCCNIRGANSESPCDLGLVNGKNPLHIGVSCRIQRRVAPRDDESVITSLRWLAKQQVPNIEAITASSVKTGEVSSRSGNHARQKNRAVIPGSAVGWYRYLQILGIGAIVMIYVYRSCIE